MDDIVGTLMLLSVQDDTNSTGIVSSGDHAHITVVESDEVLHLSGLNVEQDGVVDLDKRVWVSDGASVVGGQGWNSLLAQLDVLHLAELVRSLLRANAVNGHTSLGVVENSEAFVGLLDADNVHEPGWVAHVGAYLSVDLHETLHENGLGLASGKGILQTVTQDQDEWQALSSLVWSWRRLRGLCFFKVNRKKRKKGLVKEKKKKKERKEEERKTTRTAPTKSYWNNSFSPNTHARLSHANLIHCAKRGQGKRDVLSKEIETFFSKFTARVHADGEKEET